jgi:hypothetical protein
MLGKHSTTELYPQHLSLLLKPPVFSHSGSILLTLSNPNHLPKAPPLSVLGCVSTLLGRMAQLLPKKAEALSQIPVLQIKKFLLS